MNALNRDINQGDLIVIRKNAMPPQWRKMDQRIFCCQYGPGMQADSRGTEIDGYFLDDRGGASIRGTQIDADCTEALHKGQSIGETPGAGPSILDDGGEAVHHVYYGVQAQARRE